MGYKFFQCIFHTKADEHELFHSCSFSLAVNGRQSPFNTGILPQWDSVLLPMSPVRSILSRVDESLQCSCSFITMTTDVHLTACAVQRVKTRCQVPNS